MLLRPYQNEAIQRVRAEMMKGFKRVLMVLATGGGKTVTSGTIIKNAVLKGKRCIFLAHRKELIDQCSKTLDFLGIDHGVIKSMHPKRDLSKQVQVASIQTLIKRKHWPADLIVIDEAHRSCAPTYKEILARYGESVATLGLSVGPKSFCEFRGGPFGSGWCGPIADAYKIVSESMPERSGSLETFSTFRTETSGIESRGWDGKQFLWKKVRTFLRHKCDRDVSLIQVAGDRLLLTNDHSVYKIEPGRRDLTCTRQKYKAVVATAPSGSITKGDTLLLDNGSNWEGCEEKLFDVLTLDKKLQVRVDFSERISRVDMGVDPRAYFQWKTRSGGEGLPPRVFLKFEDSLPKCKSIHAGYNDRGVRRMVRLSDWAYMFGFYLGDGWAEGTRVCFAVENAMVGHIMAKLKSDIPELDPIVSDAAGASKEIRCSHSIISGIFSRVTGGAKVYDKFIPGEWIMSWPESARRSLLDGLIDSDGSISDGSDNRSSVYYTTTSRKLARSLLSLLRSLGLSGGCSITKPQIGGLIRGRRIIGKRIRYTVYWSYHSMVGMNSGHYGRRTKFDHDDIDFSEVPVRRVGSPKRTPKYVYDLEMDGHPSFVANGVLVHNTATPYRQDGKPLGEMYDSLVEVVSTMELIDAGYLVDPTIFGAKNVDLSNVSIGGKGDWKASELAKAMKSTILHGELLTNWTKICGGALGSDSILYTDDAGIERVSQTACDARTVIFAPNVETSIQIIDQFKAAGVRAEHLDGNTEERERERILEGLKTGEVSVVSNVGLLTEGWDLPSLECIIAARPTRSKALYKQMGGRLMRPDDDARFKFLLDHAGWTRTHGFLSEPTEHSLVKSEKRPRKNKLGEAPIKECPHCKSVCAIGTVTCGECGYDWPKREVEFTNEDLVELDSKMVNRAEVVPQSERQEVFDKFAAQCVELGRKPNYARVRYRGVYGEWPCKDVGILMPRFFMNYEREITRQNKSQMIAQAAADAAPG